jgi:hypothetical protein
MVLKGSICLDPVANQGKRETYDLDLSVLAFSAGADLVLKERAA